MLNLKGGPIFLNSGGLGPDDYLLKAVDGGRWVRVIRRSGRHFDGDRQHALDDHGAWAQIAQRIRERVCTSDNAKRYNATKTKIQTIDASAFLRTVKAIESGHLSVSQLGR